MDNSQSRFTRRCYCGGWPRLLGLHVDLRHNHKVMSIPISCHYIVGMSYRYSMLFGLLIGIFLLLLVAGCSGSQVTTPIYEPCSSNQGTESDGLTILIGSTDLIVGENRLVFALMDNDGEMVKSDSIVLSFSCQLESQAGIGSPTLHHATGILREWPYDRFVYTAPVSFHKPGIWSMHATTKTQGQSRTTTASLEVIGESTIPIKGSYAPRSVSKIFSGPTTVEELTTDSKPDLDLYSMTISEALEVGKPLVVTFATPAFCMSVTCGPQVEVIKETKIKYKDSVNFIHVEVFENPIEMREYGDKGRLSPVMIEWGLQSEPYTFVMDAEGYVAARFEGFVTGDELREAIEDTL